MSYVEGFLIPVPTAGKETYRKYASAGWPLFADFGILRLTEGWDDDVPDGKMTDFKRAVNQKPDETVLFSWLEFPSKEARVACHKNVTADPRFAKMGEMPFDGMRMVYGTFSPIVDETAKGAIRKTA